MASHMEWHLLVQEEADWVRLFLFENKVKNRKENYMNAFNNLFRFSKLGSTNPNTD